MITMMMVLSRALRNIRTFGTTFRLAERNEANDFIEDVVCQESDLKENEMKVCDLGTDGGKVLLVKQNGQINAIGTKCSHYGAPLASGALSEGRIRCPWHGACFNIKTGDIEDFPGLDSIPCYNVELTATGGVKVKARATDLKSNKRLKNMASRDTKNNNVFVVVGGGAAGLVCSETLRHEGYTGKLLLVTAEKFLPYDRIKLSKQLDLVASKIQLRSDSFYKEHDIDLMLDTKVTGLDTEKKCVITSNGQTIAYSSLFLATGATPRTLNVPGSELKNIFTLRSVSDANAIYSVLNQDLNVVIYGSSFIGMEVAAFCVGKVSKVTVIGRNKLPFIESLGETVGKRIERLFKDKGVELKMETTVESFEGSENVEGVKLSDGSILKADVVILGIGSTYATGFLKDSGVGMNKNGSIPVNKFLETNIPGIYAGGDIAEAPVFACGNEAKTIGHWGLAHYHGRIAGLNMMSNATPLKTVPFFWTMLFGIGFRYAGYGSGYDHTFTSGDVDGLKFAAYYCKDDNVIAVTTVGVDPLAAQFAELLYSGKTLSRAEAESKPLTWYKNQ